MRFALKRFYQDERQTLGTLNIQGRILFTIERPWKGNQPFHSCFTSGTYGMEVVQFGNQERKVRLHTMGHMTPERTLLNIEVANWALQLAGCVGVGLSVVYDTDRSEVEAPIYRVQQSKLALALLVHEMDRWKDPKVPMFLDVEDPT